MQKALTSPLSQPQLTHSQPLQLPSNQPLLRSTQLPSQPLANPNNQKVKVVYNIEVDTFSTYLIALVKLQEFPVQLQEINLHSGKVVNKKTVIIIKEEEEATPNQLDANKTLMRQYVIESPQSSRIPPFPERLIAEKYGKKTF